ncbi:MFS general substrate transporter [Hortaea werneckii]|nr:MFS general substrate transporter [Hortaea werneckii]
MEQDKVDSVATHVEVADAKHVSGKHIEGSALLVNKQGGIRKLPVPSGSPNDPLNWSWKAKWAVIVCCCWFSINGLAMTSGLGSVIGVFFGMYSQQGYHVEEIALLLTLPSLCIGLGNYILLPVALAYGRRPVFLASTAILFVSTIWAATQNSYKSHLGARVLSGLTTGASESLLPLMLSEVTFLHERGKVMAVYWGIQNILTGVFTIVASYEVADLSWRWYYWVFAIMVGAGLIFAFFGAFETMFHRSMLNVDGRVVVTDEFGMSQVVSDDQAQDFLDNARANDATAGDSNVRKYAYVRRIRPWSTPVERPFHTMLMTWTQMTVSLTSPAILYVVLATSTALAGIVFMSLTYDSILQGYGWSPKSVGLINIGGLVGAFIAMAYSALVAEPLNLWLAKRNRGIHNPEHRLVALVPAFVLGFASLLMYGFTAIDATSEWPVVIAYTGFQMSFISLLITTSAFAIYNC